MKCCIIGGVAGGATTAARLRRNNEQAEIIVFERGSYISYANCGLPYYIGDVIPERDRLFVQTPESFKAALNIDVRVSHEAIAIDREKKHVLVRDLTTGKEYPESYDKLVLSPGAEPVKPPIPGIDMPGIFTLRNVPDTDSIKDFIEKRKPRRAVIIGAGFIGLEMAENLHRRGIFVTIVEALDQVMSILDYEMAAEVHQHLKTKNVEFYLKDGVSSFSRAQDGHRIVVSLSSGKRIETDMVLLSIGVRPESALARNAGLATGESRGIVVNSYLQTSDPDIYAVGDAIEFPNPITGKPRVTPLAGPANRQGRIAADNIVFGNIRTYRGSIGTGIAKVFDLTVAATGLSEKNCRSEGLPYKTLVAHSSSHAGYYPEAVPMSVKVIFHPESGRLFGAQIVGYEGVDKRIHLIASILGRGGSLFDLQEIEHAYAPPYSSAKDPVHIVGFVGENIIGGKSVHITWDEFIALDPSERFLVDVRTPEEFAIDTIEGAVNIPHTEIRNRLSEIPRDRLVVLFCGVGHRAYLSERILRQNGFPQVRNLSGGFKTYSLATQKQGNEDIFSGDFIGKDEVIYQVDPYADKRPKKVIEVNACGLQCPGPIMRIKREMEKIEPGDRILQTATDPGFARDVKSWCSMTGNSLVSIEERGGKVTALVEKGSGGPPLPSAGGAENAVSLVVFSDDFDRALASFVIANGAASAGKKVTMFFTFWGLSVIKKDHRVRVKKDLMGRLFAMMLPKDSRGLSLSKMNMLGMGPVMMRKRMKSKNVDSLETMIKTAVESGVRMVGCQMSMDVMGVSAEELIDGVEIGGVAAFLEAAGKSQASLFV